MNRIGRDLRSAIRTLRKSPGFTAVVVVVLGLGIGANTAIFSLVDAALLRRLPYPEPDRLLLLPAQHQPEDMGAEVSLANFLDWRRESRSFAQLGAWAPASFDFTAGSAERVQGARITPAGLAAPGIEPLLGRTFLPEEEGPDSRVAVVSFGFWRSRFGGDPSILGRVIRLSGFEYPIVGVMPPQFAFPSADIQVWTPLRMTEPRVRDRQSRYLYAVGRLKRGVSLRAAQSEMDLLTAALAREHPDHNRNWGVRLLPIRESLVGKVRPVLLLLLATVLLVLAIACANIANLQLARAASRRREFAIRSAIGASAGDVLRQLVLEGAVLSLGGGVLGLLFTRASLGILAAWSAPGAENVRIDARVLFFTLAVSLVTGIVFGLVPARAALRPDLLDVLREQGRGASSGAGQNRFRRLLTGGQVATALVLLIGAALLLSSLVRLQRVEPGFNPKGLSTIEVVLSSPRYSGRERRAAFVRQLVDGAGRIPGVTSAAAVGQLPFGGSNSTESYRIEGQPQPPAGAAPEAGLREVTPGFFRTLEIPVLEGRDFSPHDTGGSPAVVLVNRTFARRYWPRESAVGHRIVLSDAAGVSREIVGVVADIRHTALEVPAVPEIYVSFEQNGGDDVALVARSREGSAAVAASLRAAVAALDPEQPVFHVRTMKTLLADSTARSKRTTALVGVFAALALVLAVLGVYSVISFSVARRGREFAIRLAIGGSRRDVLTLVLAEGMGVALAGIGVGLAVAWAATRALASQLFEVRADDPGIFAATAAILGAVALAACLVPAWRASRVDPVAALRAE
ncbi:MAG: ABC transporter permease [Acidobacteriota bacterium]